MRRRRGLGCTSITQRPAVLHKDILSQSEVLIALWVTGTRDVAAIDEWVGLHAEDKQAREAKASLAALPVGTAWGVVAGRLELLRRVRIRRRRTFDLSATPLPGERVATSTGFAPVDLDRLRPTCRQRRRRHCARRSARDRRRTRRLRAELRAALDWPPRVEYVEVLPAGQAQLLGESAHQLDSLGCAPTPTRCARGLQFAPRPIPTSMSPRRAGTRAPTWSRRSGRPGQAS